MASILPPKMLGHLITSEKQQVLHDHQVTSFRNKKALGAQAQYSVFRQKKKSYFHSFEQGVKGWQYTLSVLTRRSGDHCTRSPIYN